MWEVQSKHTWHEFCDIVGFAVYYHPAIFLGIVLRDLLAGEITHFGFLTLFVVHDGYEREVVVETNVAIVVTELFGSSWSREGW